MVTVFCCKQANFALSDKLYLVLENLTADLQDLGEFTFVFIAPNVQIIC